VEGNARTLYYYAGDRRIARRDFDGRVYFLHADHLGTNRELTGPGGANVGHRVYSPFGRPLEITGTTDPHGLADQKLLASGLYHMGARHMDPVLGQFTSPDPSDFPNPVRPQTLNRYSYVGNNPITLFDPTGYSWDGSRNGPTPGDLGATPNSPAQAGYSGPSVGGGSDRGGSQSSGSDWSSGVSGGSASSFVDPVRANDERHLADNLAATSGFSTSFGIDPHAWDRAHPAGAGRSDGWNNGSNGNGDWDRPTVAGSAVPPAPASEGGLLDRLRGWWNDVTSQPPRSSEETLREWSDWYRQEFYDLKSGPKPRSGFRDDSLDFCCGQRLRGVGDLARSLSRGR
jgi:RHS repeat-associated protein